jgi:hypothetical protein
VVKRTHEDEDFPEFGVRIGTFTYEYKSISVVGYCGRLYPSQHGCWELREGRVFFSSSALRSCADLLDWLNGQVLNEDMYKKYQSRVVLYLPEVIESERT